VLQTLPLLVLPALMLVAAWTDATRYTIPNWVSLALMLAFAPAAFIAGAPLAEIGISYLVGLAVLAIGIALWAPGFIGGGDAKLLAAGAVWFGWPLVLTFVLVSCLAGGVLALFLLVARQVAPQLPITRRLAVESPLAPGKPVPYAIAIAAGAFLTLPSSPLLIGWAG
jgi:prepilin peptidase CpaA